MRKIFLFWGVILVSLILGVAAIIYGKILLQEEEERADKIEKELTLPRVPTIPRPSALPIGVEIEEVPESESPPPPLPPEAPEIPTLPELPKRIDVESPETPEVPEMTPPQTPSQPAGQ